MLPSIDLRGGVEVATVSELPGVLDERFLWEFHVLRSIATEGDASGDAPLVFDPRTALILNASELLVHDPDAEQPLVLLDTESGEVTRRFGRKGNGPGELSGWLTLTKAGDGTIAVLDIRNRQIHRYSPAMVYVGSAPLDANAYLSKAMAVPDGDRVLIETSRNDPSRARALAVLNLQTAGIAPFAPLPGRPENEGGSVFLRGRALWAALEQGVVTMHGFESSLAIYDYQGTLVREINLPPSNRMVAEADIQEQQAHYGGIAGGLEPGPVGLTNELFVAHDTIFAMLLSQLWRAEEDPPLPVGRILWRMFTLRGEYVGVAWTPEGFWPLAVGDGALWARVLDEGGVPLIQKLELVGAS